ncbi:UNVERIFIED_CONTAM: hypothetical protein FKN15_073733 [Acipenser sinensis]
MNTPLFCQFNTAVRNGGGSNYKSFPFKALHFYLTTALTILHREQNSGCRDVFRGETISRTVKVGEIVRFSQFASCSVDKDRAKSFAGKDGTVFSINTCQGVPITEYSSKKYEEEVLIPPYEKFKVQSVKGNEITLSAVKGDTKSVNNCLAGGATPPGYFPLAGLVPLRVSTSLSPQPRRNPCCCCPLLDSGTGKYRCHRLPPVVPRNNAHGFWCRIAPAEPDVFVPVKLEEALTLATQFHNSLQDFINWLTQAEQTLTMATPASLILDDILFQIDEHKVFVTEVNCHREQIIELDKTGTHLKYFSQKQDVVLIKNLLISVQSRWEKVVQRSVERGRALDDARKRAKQFHEAWNKLMEWLEESEKALDSEQEIANDPDKIKMQLAQHKVIILNVSTS